MKSKHSILLGFLSLSLSVAVQFTGPKSFAEEKSPEAAKASDQNSKKQESKDGIIESIKGKVTEKIPAKNYTYLKIKTSTDEIWVAVQALEIDLNTEVEMLKPMPMFGFESKVLNRKFDRIYFGVLESQRKDNKTEDKKSTK